MENPENPSLGYSEAITTTKEVLNGRDKEACMGVKYKKFLKF